MTDFMCRYPADRDRAIVSYLYGESLDWDPAERAAFEAHLPACDFCLGELAALEGVRVSLRGWSPPEPAGLTVSQPPAARGGPWWRDIPDIPAWAQVAAALLFLGVGLGMANLDVRYDANGLRVRTGWATGASLPARPFGSVSDVSAGTPWRADLTALELRLRADRGQPAKSVANPVSAVSRVNPASADAASAETLRRARSLIEESERRQQRELALRLAEVMRDLSAQRNADLAKIDRSIGAMQNNTGLEMLKQRETINNINSYLVRTSSQQRPQ